MGEKRVSLVIPGRNCARTIRPCLTAVVPFLQTTPLGEIVFVDDGSKDETASIVREFPVRLVPCDGRGPGAARNTGWNAAQFELIWFVDSDCVAEDGALDRLLPAMDDPEVGGVSGSYGNMNPQSLLACLIHEEIVERHRRMPSRVNFLATFNVLYRRAALERVGGFDGRFLKAQDAELSFRVMEAGYELRFVLESRVKHFHETRWLRYLRTQRQQGYWRVFLHLSHRGHSAGDSYSSIVDHVQPPLAVLVLVMLPLPAIAGLSASAAVMGTAVLIPAACVLALMATSMPMTVRLVRRLRRVRYLMFSFMSFVRAFWRGVGMTHALLALLVSRGRLPRPMRAQPADSGPPSRP